VQEPKIIVVDNPTVVLCPSPSMEPPWISAYTFSN